MFPDTAEVEGFRTALRADPEAARRVFADWLEERGDPRAAWLRDPEIWAWMAPDAHDPVPPLLEATQAEDGERRRQAGELLAKLGTPAIPALRAWTRQDPSHRWDITRWALAAGRPPELRPVPELMERLGGASWYDCWEAIIDLGFHGPPAAPAVPRLMTISYFEEFAHFDRNPLQQDAYRVLAELGAAAVEAIPSLVAALSYGWDTAEAAAAALRSIAPAAPDVLLAHVGDSGDERGRKWALQILVETHPQGLRVLGPILRGETGPGDGPALAAIKLEEAGPEAAELVPDLIEALSRPAPSQSSYNHLLVAEALGKLGEPARAAVPALRAALAEYEAQGPDGGAKDSAREAIAAALAKLGDPAAGLAAIAAGLASPDEDTRARSVTLAAEIAAVAPEAVPHVLRGLEDPSVAVRQIAAAALCELASPAGDPHVLVSALLRALKDSSQEVRREAITALGKLKGERPALMFQLVMPGKEGPYPDAFDREDAATLEEQTLRGLVRALTDRSPGVRAAAVGALGRWEELPGSVVAPLRRFVRNCQDSSEAAQALGVLRKASAFPGDLVPEMIALFRHEDEEVAGAAADLLTRVGAAAVPALVAALGSPEQEVVGSACRALHDMGEQAAAAAPHLLPLASDPDVNRRRLVIEILGQLGAPEVTVPALRRALADSNARVREQAAWSLGRLGPAAAAAVPELLEATRGRGEGVRYAALYGLARVGAAAATALPVYQAALRSRDPNVRRAALEGIQSLGTAATAAFGTVAARCRDKDESVRIFALSAAAAIAPGPEQMIDLCRALLHDPQEDVRDHTAKIFLGLGAPALEQAPDLFALCRQRGVRVSRLLRASLHSLSARALRALVPSLRESLADEDQDSREAAALALRVCGPAGVQALQEALADENENVRAAAEHGLRARVE